MKLFVIAAGAVILWILQGCLYHCFWARGLKASVSFDRAFAVEGEHAVLKETITNAKALPLPILHIKFQMGRHLVFVDSGNSAVTDQNYRSDIFSCMPWQEIRRRLELCCKKRGYYTISQIQLVSYDLFFSGHFVSSLPGEASLYVYPKAVAFERLAIPFRNLSGQILARQALILDPFETQSIRPYESYDPYRSVNWKATARTGSLKVNVYTPTSSWKVCFLLDVDSDRIWKDEDLTEEAIRLCGSYSQTLIKEGIPVSIHTNGPDCITGKCGYLEYGAGTEHGRSIMELLARIQVGDASHPAMEQILKERADALLAGSGSMIYILLSPVRRPSMSRAFASLCRQSPGSQWILPVRPKEDIQLEQNSSFSVFPWEVPYDHS